MNLAGQGHCCLFRVMLSCQRQSPRAFLKFLGSRRVIASCAGFWTIHCTAVLHWPPKWCLAASHAPAARCCPGCPAARPEQVLHCLQAQACTQIPTSKFTTRPAQHRRSARWQPMQTPPPMANACVSLSKTQHPCDWRSLGRRGRDAARNAHPWSPAAWRTPTQRRQRRCQHTTEKSPSRPAHASAPERSG